jgi:hypothetical protein
MNAKQEAKDILVYYLRLLAVNQGIMWNEDNNTEVSSIIDYIIEAIKHE